MYLHVQLAGRPSAINPSPEVTNIIDEILSYLPRRSKPIDIAAE